MNSGPPEAAACRPGRWLLVLALFVTPFSTAAVEIASSLLLATWLMGWVLPRHRPTSWRNPSCRNLLIALGSYLGVCLLSIVMSGDPALGLRGFFRKTLEYALLFLAAADLIQGPRVFRWSVRAWIAASLGVVAYSLLQEWSIATARYAVQAMDPILGRPVEFIRMVGPYKNPNDLATFLMVMILVLAPHLMRLTGRARVSLGILTVALFGCLIRTESMGGLLGLGVGLLLIWFFGLKKKIGSKVLGLSLAVIGAIFIFTSSEPWGALTFTDSASHDRLRMWSAAWRMILDRPWFGHGLNTFMANYSAYAPAQFTGPSYAHNVLLQIAAETGWIGLAAFLWFQAALAAALWRGWSRPDGNLTPEKRLGLLGLAAGMAAFLIQSVFDTNFYALRQAILFWTLAGCAFGISQRSSAPA